MNFFHVVSGNLCNTMYVIVPKYVIIQKYSLIPNST